MFYSAFTWSVFFKPNIRFPYGKDCVLRSYAGNSNFAGFWAFGLVSVYLIWHT